MSADPRFWLAVTLATVGALIRALYRLEDPFLSRGPRF